MDPRSRARRFWDALKNGFYYLTSSYMLLQPIAATSGLKILKSVWQECSVSKWHPPHRLSRTIPHLNIPFYRRKVSDSTPTSYRRPRFKLGRAEVIGTQDPNVVPPKLLVPEIPR